MTVSARDAKREAIAQWTADPCGDGTIEARDAYAPWIPEVLDYGAWADSDVLDVGCGQGVDVARYLQAGARVTGIDLTPRHIELAGELLERLDLQGKLLVGDAEALPFSDATFDRVSSNGVLHHTPDIRRALREIRRVLRPGGEAMVIVYNRNSLHYWLHQFLLHGVLLGELIRERGMQGVLSRNVEVSSTGARPLVRVYSPKQISALMRDSGFDAVATTVRHFHETDTFPTKLASRLIDRLRDPEFRDSIGRRVGWYVVARGRRSA